MLLFLRRRGRTTSRKQDVFTVRDGGDMQEEMTWRQMWKGMEDLQRERVCVDTWRRLVRTQRTEMYLKFVRGTFNWF